MVEPLRHRQTKEAATDMFCLKPPRHISTLHFAAVGVNQRGVPDATPTACAAGKLLVTGCFSGLRGTDTVPDLTESGGADTEVFTALGAANFSGPCSLPPFNHRRCST